MSEMHNAETGKLLKAHHSVKAVFYNALWSARQNLRKKNHKRDSPIKSKT